MGWRLKLVEGAVSITIGTYVAQVGQQLWESGEQLFGALLQLLGWALVVVNLVVFGAGVSEGAAEKVLAALRKEE